MVNGVEYLQYYLFVNGMNPKWSTLCPPLARDATWNIGKSYLRRTLSFGLVNSGGHYVCLHNFS
jgi:hypothetical protein